MSFLQSFSKIERESIPGETGEDIAKMVGYSVSPKTGEHWTFKILQMSSRFGQYTWQHNNFQYGIYRNSEVQKQNLACVTSSVASGIAIKFASAFSPINHWYFKSNSVSLIALSSLTKAKWQWQASSSYGLSIEASFSRYPGGSCSFHCSSKNWNVESGTVDHTLQKIVADKIKIKEKAVPTLRPPPFFLSNLFQPKQNFFRLLVIVVFNTISFLWTQVRHITVSSPNSLWTHPQPGLGGRTPNHL